MQANGQKTSIYTTLIRVVDAFLYLSINSAAISEREESPE